MKNLKWKKNCLLYMTAMVRVNWEYEIKLRSEIIIWDYVVYWFQIEANNFCFIYFIYVGQQLEDIFIIEDV